MVIGFEKVWIECLTKCLTKFKSRYEGGSNLLILWSQRGDSNP
jgi:hypothetical protein